MNRAKKLVNEELADFSHLVLCVARDISLYTPLEDGIIELSNIESLVLSHVDRNPGHSLSQIGSKVGLRASNISTIVRDLEKSGLIRRVSDQKDRRSFGIHTTSLAASNLEKVRIQWIKLLSPHIDDINALIPLIELLKKLDESITNNNETSILRSLR